MTHSPPVRPAQHLSARRNVRFRLPRRQRLHGRTADAVGNRAADHGKEHVEQVVRKQGREDERNDGEDDGQPDEEAVAKGAEADARREPAARSAELSTAELLALVVVARRAKQRANEATFPTAVVVRRHYVLSQL